MTFIAFITIILMGQNGEPVAQDFKSKMAFSSYQECMSYSADALSNIMKTDGGKMVVGFVASCEAATAA